MTRCVCGRTVSAETLEGADELMCVICHEPMSEGGKQLPCKHVFHAGCVQEWIQQSPSCPSCRAPIGGDPPSQSGDGAQPLIAAEGAPASPSMAHAAAAAVLSAVRLLDRLLLPVEEAAQPLLFPGDDFGGTLEGGGGGVGGGDVAAAAAAAAAGGGAALHGRRPVFAVNSGGWLAGWLPSLSLQVGVVREVRPPRPIMQAAAAAAAAAGARDGPGAPPAGAAAAAGGGLLHPARAGLPMGRRDSGPAAHAELRVSPELQAMVARVIEVIGAGVRTDRQVGLNLVLSGSVQATIDNFFEGRF
jgi:hypothetical protein